MTKRTKKLKVLIIGACGFIGSNLTKRLLQNGYSVTAIIGECGLRYLEGFNHRKLSFFSFKDVENNLKKIGRFSYVFNLSGYIDIRESFENPLKYELNKPVTTIRLIEEVKTEKFINVSTANVYDFTNNSISENSPIKPASPYAISQLAADYYTITLCNYHKIPYLILRLFNPYGPPNIYRGIIATIINGLLKKEEVILYNPQRKFDFTFIDDIVEAMIFCASRKEGIINIGTGRPILLIDIYRKLSFIIYKKYIKPNIILSGKFRDQLFSNSNKLKRSGFKFKYDIDEGLRRTVSYYMNIAKNKA